MSNVLARLDEHETQLGDHEKRIASNELAIFGGRDPETNQRHIGALEVVETGVRYLRSIKNALVWSLRGMVAIAAAVAGACWWLATHLADIAHLIKAL